MATGDERDCGEKEEEEVEEQESGGIRWRERCVQRWGLLESRKEQMRDDVAREQEEWKRYYVERAAVEFRSANGWSRDGYGDGRSVSSVIRRADADMVRRWEETEGNLLPSTALPKSMSEIAPDMRPWTFESGGVRERHDRLMEDVRQRCRATLLDRGFPGEAADTPGEQQPEDDGLRERITATFLRSVYVLRFQVDWRGGATVAMLEVCMRVYSVTDSGGSVDLRWCVANTPTDSASALSAVPRVLADCREDRPTFAVDSVRHWRSSSQARRNHMMTLAEHNTACLPKAIHPRAARVVAEVLLESDHIAAACRLSLRTTMKLCARVAGVCATFGSDGEWIFRYTDARFRSRSDKHTDIFPDETAHGPNRCPSREDDDQPHDPAINVFGVLGPPAQQFETSGLQWLCRDTSRPIDLV